MRLNYNSEKHQGLGEAEAREMLERHGPNELPSSKPRGFLPIAMGVAKEPMFILLVACGTLYLLLGDFQEGIMLLCFVVVIMGIEFYQERKTERALDALKDLASPRALVIRDGVERRVAGRDVAMGDLIVLQEGDRVPADATVLESTSLSADESLLTGEAVPARKRDWDGAARPAQPGGDDLPFVYSGSMITQGNGVARVTAVGVGTEMGKIGRSLESVKDEPTRLNREMSWLVGRITAAAFALCMLVVAAHTLTRGGLVDGLLAGITLAMAILPEEFPVILSIFMALGAWRMSRRRVLTRRPSAIETLGSATVLCSDKTGTITENRMTVARLHNGRESMRVERTNGIGEDFHEIIEYGMLSSQTNPFDPMEKAINRLGDLHLARTEHIHNDWEMVREYPLSREMLAMSRVFSNKGTRERTIAAKGAPEAIFDLCHLDSAESSRLAAAVGQMASEGLRVLGVAKARIRGGGLPETQHDFQFEFVGLVGLSDPVRGNIREAVEECRAAGVRVVMITGDYPETAKNIAREIGLENHDCCVTGQELREMFDDELGEKIRSVNVFARVVPEQKLKIVRALKANNEVVAMTGDGVNDAPALKAADIGVAMGEKGTDVAREASSLVLMDDNFSSIVGAIRMGRRIFDNLQKAFAYVFAIHVPIAGLSLVPVLVPGMPLMLWPVHIVFLELIIDPACSIIFEAEKEEKNVMSRPPRRESERFFGPRKILFCCLQGAGILAVCMAVCLVATRLGLPEAEVRAMTFTTLVVSNLAVILTNRSWSENIFKILATPNKAVVWVSAGAMFFLALVLNVPFFLDMFKFEPLSLLDVAICAAAGLASVAWFEIYKALGLAVGRLAR